MAADALSVPANNLVKFFNGTFDFDTDTFKLALFNSSYVTTTQTYSTTNELATANGYTQGGITLAGVSLAEATGTVTFDANDVVWTASGGSITARYAVLYDDTAAGDDIVGFILLDNTPADVTATDGNTLTVQWNSNGIWTAS